MAQREYSAGAYMSTPYDDAYIPPVPVLVIRLAAPGEAPTVGPFSAVIDTGADGTLVPTEYLEQVEAIGVAEAILHGILGESREVHLYEVDLHINTLALPGVLVAGYDQGQEIILGRNVLNKLVLLLDGHSRQTDLFELRPEWRSSS